MASRKMPFQLSPKHNKRHTNQCHNSNEHTERSHFVKMVQVGDGLGDGVAQTLEGVPLGGTQLAP
jgi:hypothetical protein